MPNIVSRRLSYVADIAAGGTQFRTFKIKEQYADLLPEYQAIPLATANCPTGGLFKLRAAIATFSTGEKIRFPISLNTTAGIQSVITALIDAGALCVDLDGESWTQIPGSTVAIPSYTIPDGFSDKNTGIMTYNSDVAGPNQQVPVAIEIAPIALSAAAAGCAGTLIVAAACSTTLPGFKARAFTATAGNATTLGKVVRKAPLDARANIITCLDSLQDITPCVGYKGETVRNAHLYVPQPV